MQWCCSFALQLGIRQITCSWVTTSTGESGAWKQFAYSLPTRCVCVAPCSNAAWRNGTSASFCLRAGEVSGELFPAAWQSRVAIDLQDQQKQLTKNCLRSEGFTHCLFDVADARSQGYTDSMMSANQDTASRFGRRFAS